MPVRSRSHSYGPERSIYVKHLYSIVYNNYVLEYGPAHQIQNDQLTNDGNGARERLAADV